MQSHSTSLTRGAGSIFAVLLCLAALSAAKGDEPRLSITASTASAKAQVGQTILLNAAATRAAQPVAGQELWAYLNGKRWGASAVTDARGQAKFMLAFPQAGMARIEVIPGQDTQGPLRAAWIWAGKVRDAQAVYFTKTFSVPGSVRNATLSMTCDDRYEAFLNGHPIAQGTTFKEVQQVRGLERWLKAGTNLLAVRGYNGGGPAGLLAALRIDTAAGAMTIPSDATWRASEDAPVGWPAPTAPTAPAGAVASVQAQVGGGAWGTAIEGWPGMLGAYPVGRPMPTNAPRSSPLTLRVAPRPIPVARDPNHLIGMDWQPWFTRDGGANWDTAEAIPVLGKYASADPDVARQHVLWMDDMGIDFLISDWSNNISGGQSWNTYPIAANGMIQNTTNLLDVLAQMRSEGLPTPQVTLLLGIGAPAALKGELQYVEDTYIKNPRYQGLWVQLGGKPLIEILSGQTQTVVDTWPPVDPNGNFAIRWEWIDLARHPQNRAGWWSWMEAVIDPAVTYHNGLPEAMTITPAFFTENGWLGSDAVTRRGGATYLHEFQNALNTKPQFLQINQWNEYLASAKGQGGGPKHDIYYDIYDAPRSDDIEPTTPFVTGYRGDRGWGFRYLNLTRAMVRLYRAKTPDSTLLAVASPEAGQSVSGKSLHVEWSAAGKPVESYTLLLDGRVAARALHAEAFDLPLGNVLPGRHMLTLKANGAVTRFPISDTDVDRDLTVPRPVVATVEFLKAASS